MKKLNLIFTALLLSKLVCSQTFSAGISPSSNTILQGGSGTASYSVNITPSGGFSSSVYFQLILPPLLNGVVTLSPTLVNSPYPTVVIHANNTNSLPPGNHKIILKSYNAGVADYDTCSLIVSPNACPNWFAYTDLNSVLSANRAMAVAVDKSDNFWLGSAFGTAPGTIPMKYGGLACFDKNNWYVWTTVDYRIYDINGIETFSTSTQKILNDGIINIATHGDTVYAISSKNIYVVINKNLSIFPAPATADDLVNIKVENNGRLWVSTNHNVFNYSNNTWNPFNYTNAPFLNTNGIEDFDVDNNGFVWFAAGGNVQKFDWNFWTTFNSASGLSSQILAISKSGDGSIWAGSSSTICKFNPASNTFTSLSFANSVVGPISIKFDKHNNPIVGSFVGLAVFSGNSYTVYNLSNSPVIPNGNGGLSRMGAMDSQNNLMVADWGGGFIFHCANLTVTQIKENTFSQQDLIIYPNPSSSEFQISLPEDIKEYRINIYNLNGELIYKQENSEKTQIHLEVQSGIYFLQVADKRTNAVCNKKIQIVK